MEHKKIKFKGRQKLIVGQNDLTATHSDLCEEWDYEKNFPLIPENFSAGSEKKVFWLCSEGHSYPAMIFKRKNGQGCPYCSGKKILKGFNDLATTHPNLCKEWDYEKNFPLTPQEVSAGITKKVFWLCDEGHSYYATINNRTNNKTGCPYCVGKKILKGFNDLATTHPNLCEEWDYEKNFPLKPQEVSAGSNKEVFWLCSEGHSYSAKIYTRTNMKCGCPYCSGRKTLTGFNDLATTHPNLCEEWDYEKNFPLTPQEVSAGSHKKFFWLCSERHSYFSAINNRTNNKTGCPHCATKKSEKFIGTLLSNLGISYKTQVSFQGCKDRSLLLFDFLIDDFRFEEFLLERQGEQHEKPIDFAGKGEEWAKKELESNQRRDKIKYDFCQETGKILEYIWYYENEIETLINLLRKHIKPEYNLDEILNTTREQAA